MTINERSIVFGLLCLVAMCWSGVVWGNSQTEPPVWAPLTFQIAACVGVIVLWNWLFYAVGRLVYRLQCLHRLQTIGVVANLMAVAGLVVAIGILAATRGGMLRMPICIFAICVLVLNPISNFFEGANDKLYDVEHPSMPIKPTSSSS